MGRNTDPVCKMCRREGMKLYLKGAKCDTKCILDRRQGVLPGMHGYRRPKLSEYGIRLREKQRLKRFYGVFEAQFRRYFALATRSPSNTGEVLLSILERRLDNVVHRLGWAPSRPRRDNSCRTGTSRSTAATATSRACWSNRVTAWRSSLGRGASGTLRR